MNRIVDTGCTTFSGGFEVFWEDDQGYFGNITFVEKSDKILVINSETMGSEFIKAVLNKMIDMAEIKG